MNIRLFYWWTQVRDSYWFLPALMGVAAVVMAFCFLRLDVMIGNLDEKPGWLGWIYGGGADGAREVLSTIAGSMITVAGVTFSITIVALTLASSQLGPRVLRNFMRDRRHQLVLGTFTSTFIYCLLILRTVKDNGDDTFVPQLSVTGGVLLGILSLGVLIYFIHHVSVSIQASHVVKLVAEDFADDLKKLFPEQIGADPDERSAELAPASLTSRPVHIGKSGYLAAVQGESLIDLAREIDGVIHLGVRPGDFLIGGAVVATVSPGERADDDILKRVADSLVVSGQRTPLQDIRYSIDQLSEIAVRALSTGINDPYTAMEVVDRISQGIWTLLERDCPTGRRCDGDGRVRVIAEPVTFAELVEQALGPIRHAGRDVPVVLERILVVLAGAAGRVRRSEDREVLREQVERVMRVAREQVSDPAVLERIEGRHREATAALGVPA